MAENGRTAYLKRKVHFSASHRLCSAHLTEEENQKTYGKCYRTNGHGHNYTVEVTLRGEVDPKTGMILNIDELRKAMEVAIMEPLDHRHLDKDVPYFADHVSTTENLCIYVWDQMARELKDNRKLLLPYSAWATTLYLTTLLCWGHYPVLDYSVGTSFRSPFKAVRIRSQHLNTCTSSPSTPTPHSPEHQHLIHLNTSTSFTSTPAPHSPQHQHLIPFKTSTSFPSTPAPHSPQHQRDHEPSLLH
ncbi:hypothetical protein EMCRGX_G028731 [Ephydatia muelleri]